MNFIKVSPIKFFALGAGITLVLNLFLYVSQMVSDSEVSSTAITKSPAFSTQISTWFSGNADASAKNDGQSFVNGMGMRFVRLPGLDIAFGTHEVSREQFRFFAESAGLSDQRWLNRITRAGLSQPDNHPVVNVSWEEANQFCKWLSEQEGMVFRLPTDYEWSVAAGMKRETGFISPDLRSREAPEDYFWGSKWMTDLAFGNVADISYQSITGVNGGFTFDDGFPATAPIGSFLPNEHGIFDMGGNVSEWVYDWYRGRDEYKTVRGASYSSTMLHKEIHYKGFRSMSSPSFRSETFGFRVVAETSDSLQPMEGSDPILVTTNTHAQPAMPSATVTSTTDNSGELPYENSPVEDTEDVIVKPFPTFATQGIVDPEIPEETVAPELLEEAIKPVRVTYTGKDGINIRKERSFGSSTKLGAVFSQTRIPIKQIGDDSKVDTETWVNVEVEGWIPTKNSTHTYLKSQGDGTWKVVWSKPGDRYVAMRSGASSDDALISKVSYGTVVEESDSKKVGSRHYIYGKYAGWVVKRNTTRSYITDIK